MQFSTLKRALLLPGSGYTAMAPLLYGCTAMLEEEGWDVLKVSWPNDQPNSPDPYAMVEAAVEQEALTTSYPDLIIAKSLGTYAAGWAARHHVLGVWLTPVASDPRVLAALRTLDCTSLVVAGTRDPYWTPGELRDAAVHTLEVEDANHSLESKRWRASLQLQEGVYDTINKHLFEYAFGSR